MADEQKVEGEGKVEGTPAAAPAAPAAPAPAQAQEPSVLESIRQELAVDDASAQPAPDPAPAAEAEGAPPAEGEPPAEPPATAQEAAEAAAAGFEITEEELATLVNDLVTRTEQSVVSKAEQKKRAETLNEAIKMAEEDGDFTELGKLALQSYKATSQQEAARAEAAKAAEVGRAQAYEELDEVVESVYGDILDTLSPEELDALDRSKFASDKEHMQAVFKQLDSKRGDVIRSTVASEQEQAAEAAAAAATAARAQAGGVGVLPGGSGEQRLGDDIGTLLRQGLQSGEDVESD